MKNILYLSYDGLTDPLGQSQILPYIIELSKLGFSFSIISFEKKEAAYSESEISEQIAPYKIDWYPISYTKQPPVLATVWDVFRLSKKVQSLLRKKEITLIHCRSYITSLVGLQMKKKENIPFIFDMRGFWADERVDGGIWDLKNPLFNLVYRYFKSKEKQFCKFSDAIISLTYAGKKEMKKWKIEGISEKIAIIPCAVDVDLFKPTIELKREAEKIKSKLFPQNSKVLLYSGSLGTWYMLKEMLDFFISLQSIDSSWYFLFLTRDSETLKKERNRLPSNIKEKVIDLEVKRNEIPKFLMVADFSIFFIVPKYSKISSFPTKHAEFLAMGIPTIANEGVGDVKAIVEKGKNGIIIDKFDKETFRRKALEIKNFKSESKNLGDFANREFSLQKSTNIYNSIYLNILEKK